MRVEESSLLRTAEVRFGRLTQEVSLICLPDATAGDWVVVHAGFAIAKVESPDGMGGVASI
jgi:hydrogenase expression/formation protein HypC